MTKKAFSFLLALVLVLSLLPAGSVITKAAHTTTGTVYSLTDMTIDAPLAGVPLPTNLDIPDYNDEFDVYDFIWSWTENGQQKSYTYDTWSGDDSSVPYALPNTEYTLTIGVWPYLDDEEFFYDFDEEALHTGLNDNVKVNGQICYVEYISFVDLKFHCTFSTAGADISGSCGDNMTWEYYSAGNSLRLTGSGNMYDFDFSDGAPWADYTIKNIAFSDEITSIGANAFAGSDVTRVVFPKSLTTIGENAFASCSALSRINCYKKLINISANAFNDVNDNFKALFFTKESHLSTLNIGTGNEAFKNNLEYQGIPKLAWTHKSLHVKDGNTASFELRATDNFTFKYYPEATESEISFIWEVNKDGTWLPCADDPIFNSYYQYELSFTASLEMNGYQIRCKVTNDAGTKTTAAQTIEVYTNKPVITSDPVSVTAYDGDTVSFSVAAAGANLKYQWQYYANGKWSDVKADGANEPTYSLNATMAKSGRQYRCNITNSYGSATSLAAELTVISGVPVITKNPSSVNVPAGSTVSFKVAATGKEPLTYQWQVYKDGAWKNCTATGYNTNIYSFKATAAMTGRRYRCKITNAAGTVTSKYGTLTVTAPQLAITTQPSSKTVTAGTTVSFNVQANGTGTLSYQWQVSKDNGATWSNCTAAGYNTDTYSFKTTTAMSGRQYRCIVKDNNGKVTSTAAILTVNAAAVAPTITKQPQAITAPAGTMVYFTVKVSGTAPLTYQWQVSKDNGTTWTNCTATGCKTDTYSFSITKTMNGRQYRCNITNAAGTITSKAVKLTVVD